MDSIKLLATLSIIIISVAFVSGIVPADAHSLTAPATNIQAFNGHNPGEVILTWNAVAEATHYRIGCVNMGPGLPPGQGHRHRQLAGGDGVCRR